MLVHNFKWPDKSTTSYDVLHFKVNKKIVMDISANSKNVAYAFGFATYDVQLPEIYVSYFCITFKI